MWSKVRAKHKGKGHTVKELSKMYREQQQSGDKSLAEERIEHHNKAVDSQRKRDDSNRADPVTHETVAITKMSREIARRTKATRRCIFSLNDPIGLRIHEDVE